VLKARCCLVCGRRLTLVRQAGRTRRRCPACGWTYYVNPVPAVVALIARGERLLLTRRARPPYPGTWDLPGGFLEGDESPEIGLRRELREELAVRVQGARFLGFARDRYGPRGFPILTLVYRATIEGTPRPGDDVSEARWFPRQNVPWRQIAFPGLRRLLRRLVARPARGGGTGPGVRGR
jgi:ADP-ribose pyrophosphatase YjhB (NUDIX family)